jgi:hypothetical protein
MVGRLVKFILSSSPEDALNIFMYIYLQLGVLFLPSSLKRGCGFSCTSNVKLSKVADTSLLFHDFMLDMIKSSTMVTEKRYSYHTFLTMEMGKEKDNCANQQRITG